MPLACQLPIVIQHPRQQKGVVGLAKASITGFLTLMAKLAHLFKQPTVFFYRNERNCGNIKNTKHVMVRYSETVQDAWKQSVNPALRTC